MIPVAREHNWRNCIALSSTEAELIALADCAIELLAVMGVTAFLGRKLNKAVRVYTDNKGAYDLCHRFTTSQHSRHIDRKIFKMRELRGAGVTEVHWLPGAVGTDESGGSFHKDPDEAGFRDPPPHRAQPRRT